jgi:predicted metal-dependent enzyme (double-stranded beta helix superfamily)
MDRDRLCCVDTAAGAGDPAGASALSAAGRVVARINALGPPDELTPEGRERVLTAVKAIAERLDVDDCAGESTGYGRCLLHEDPAGWSLAAIALRPGQTTPIHDHGGWGGAVTVRGVERDRRFVADHRGGFQLVAERDYPAGTGYLFDPAAIHQPVGADPKSVTVALHFLVHPSSARPQHHREHVPTPSFAGA